MQYDQELGMTTRFWKNTPHSKQLAALMLQDVRELFYGGAAGGGKSDYLLMEASLYADNPDSKALILRENYKVMMEPDSILDRAIHWWVPMGVKYEASKHRFVFPSGAIVQFGHLERPDSHLDYDGMQINMVGYDEAGNLLPHQMVHIHHRLGRINSKIPNRIRYASNPGGPSHDWLRNRFVKTEPTEKCVYVPAYIADNPGLPDDYESFLETLDPVTKAQRLYGDWDIVMGTGFIDVSKIKRIRNMAPVECKRVRFWDTAATPVSPGVHDPDWTVGMKMARWDDAYIIEDVVLMRDTWGAVKAKIRETAERDEKVNRKVIVGYEQALAGVGKQDAHELSAYMAGFTFRPHRVRGSKEVRARAFAAAVDNGLVYMVENQPWEEQVLFQLSQFPDRRAHDDVVDAASGGFGIISGRPSRGGVKWT